MGRSRGSHIQCQLRRWQRLLGPCLQQGRDSCSISAAPASVQCEGIAGVVHSISIPVRGTMRLENSGFMTQRCSGWLWSPPVAHFALHPKPFRAPVGRRMATLQQPDGDGLAAQVRCSRLGPHCARSRALASQLPCFGLHLLSDCYLTAFHDGIAPITGLGRHRSLHAACCAAPPAMT